MKRGGAIIGHTHVSEMIDRQVRRRARRVSNQAQV
jgi:hypothetical protein